MNKTNNNTKEQKPRGPVTCMDCKNSLLHRYGNNPVLAACKAQPQPYNVRFPFAVEVAGVKRKCPCYINSTEVKTIEQRKAA